MTLSLKQMSDTGDPSDNAGKTGRTWDGNWMP